VAMAERGKGFEEEFPTMRREAYRTAFGVLFDAQLAEDATVEAMTQTWLHWGTIAEATYRTAWVRRVALHASLRIVRRRTRRDEPCLSPPTEFEQIAAARLTLTRALLSLPRRQREVVGLRYLADLSDTDVADALGISVNSVKTHLRRGLAGLRNRIEAEEVNELGAAALA